MASLKKLFAGEKPRVLRVNVVYKIDEETFIIQDASDSTILKIEAKYEKSVEVDKGLLLVGPEADVDGGFVQMDKNISPQKMRLLNIPKIEDEKFNKLAQFGVLEGGVVKMVNLRKIEKQKDDSKVDM